MRFASLISNFLLLLPLLWLTTQTQALPRPGLRLPDYQPKDTPPRLPSPEPESHAAASSNSGSQTHAHDSTIATANVVSTQTASQELRNSVSRYHCNVAEGTTPQLTERIKSDWTSKSDECLAGFQSLALLFCCIKASPVPVPVSLHSPGHCAHRLIHRTIPSTLPSYAYTNRAPSSLTFSRHLSPKSHRSPVTTDTVTTLGA
ncbi:hypothetical protein H0H93_016035 [Arthromyces matolae]|nr:hypothetical protein H0H93_016035 [Arthromyces matolae]